jgi:hypothetical protein
MTSWRIPGARHGIRVIPYRIQIAASVMSAPAERWVR